jgi:hypothetical protein
VFIWGLLERRRVRAHGATRLRSLVYQAVKGLNARVQEYTRFKDELRGFFYLKPQPYAVIPDGHVQYELVGPKQFELLLMLPIVKLTQSDGSFIDRTLSFIWFSRHGEWMLQNRQGLSDAHMHITIKRAGSDEWTRVEMFNSWQASWRVRPGGKSPRYTVLGTSFKNGDLMNVRYVHSGQSHPVSFDGTEATNIFPLRAGVIGQA